MDTTTIIDSLTREINTILIFLERPIVRSQLTTLLLIIGVGWLLSVGFSKLNNRYHFLSEEISWQKNLRIFIDNLFFPIFILILLLNVTYVYELSQQPATILQDARFVIFILIFYEVCLTTLYLRYSEPQIKPIHDRVLRPTFTFIVAYLIINNIVNVPLIGRIEIMPLFDGMLTVAMLIRATIILYVFGTIAYFIRQAQERVVNTRQSQTESAALSSVLIVGRYIVIAIGIITIAGSFGINLTTLAFIGGGLSIGIGFGLQQIIANFISGILLLFEQSLRPGDIIDLDGTLGEVKQVNIRSTTVLTKNNVEIIVPNERFLTNEVKTYTRNNTQVRVGVQYGISYNDDPQFTRNLVLKTVSQHGSVRKSPPPEVDFLGFGDSSLDFSVWVWMDNPINIPRFRSDLYFMIWSAFAKHNIEIPFPQRDLNLRTGWEQLAPPSGETEHDRETEEDDD